MLLTLTSLYPTFLVLAAFRKTVMCLLSNRKDKIAMYMPIFILITIIGASITKEKLCQFMITHKEIISVYRGKLPISWSEKAIKK